VRRWRLAQAEKKKEEARPTPVIAISREFGAQGARIGKIAADALDFEFWDQELVHAIAERTGVSETLVETLDEHARGALDDLIAASLIGDRGTEYTYLRELHRVVHTVQKHGAAVIIGRGAQFILKPSECLRVRVIAPLTDRIAGFAEREGMTLAEADAHVKAIEKDRRTFIRQTFHADVGDPGHYDLVLNMAALTVEAAGAIVVAAYRARFG
jgi:cytidylate kinase